MTEPTGATAQPTTTGDTTSDDVAEQFAAGCGFPRPCADASIDCGSAFEPAVCTQDYSPQIKCALEKLAAGEGFALKVDVSNYNAENEQYHIVFDGKGGAARQHWAGLPFGSPQKCDLLPKEKFAECLAVANDDPLHSECMVVFNWMPNCVGGDDVVCPAP